MPRVRFRTANSRLPSSRRGRCSAVARLGRPLTERVVGEPDVALPVDTGAVLGRVEIWSGTHARRLAATWSLHVRVPKPRPRGRLRVVRRPDRPPPRPVPHAVIVTVTLNAADRPHADRAELSARAAPSRERGADPRRRQGHQHRARAEDARRPGRRDRARRRRHGHAHRRGADREAILNDFVRIDDESRTSTAVVDPTGGTYTEINEWGPAVTSERARDPAREAPLPDAGRRARRLRRLAAARRRRRLLRRGDPRARAPPRARGARHGGRAAAARRRGGAVPRLAEPERGRGARRPGVPRRRGLPARRSSRSPSWAPRNVLDHDRDGLRRAAARGARAAPSSAPSPRASSPSRRSAPATCCWPRFLAARHAGRSPEEALRSAVAAGAASTLEVGAGRFDPRQAGPVAGRCRDVELERVAGRAQRAGVIRATR